MTVLIYLADLTHTATITNADTFPLGIGSVAAYAKAEFGDEVEFELFKFPDELNAALSTRAPEVIGFSNYSWSHHLTMAFVDHVKRTTPHVVTIMGGPNISIDETERQVFLEERPSIDFYIKWEGEITFSDLLRRLIKADFDIERVKAGRPLADNLIYLVDGDYIEGPDYRLRDLSLLPSPYTSGMLDKFFDQRLRPLIEATRGCPYACTFCTDSHPHRNKVVRRGQEFFREELVYIASRMKSAADLMLADLNFGIFKEDLETARTIRDVIDRFGWPKTITGAPGKSHPERVLETVRIINDKRGVLKFAASMQSTDPTVLDAISRKNLPIESIESVMAERTADFSDKTEYFTELILALPGESKDSHFRSLRDCVDRLNMNIVNVHQLTLLQGTPMALKEHRERYQLDVRHRVMVGCIGSYRIGDDEVPGAEIEEVVVGNKDMSFDEWLECRVMNLLVKMYIDRDYFVEILGLIRRLGLSRLDLLWTIQQKYIERYPRLKGVIDQFLTKSVEPLYADKAELIEFTASPETLEMYATGELGGNELLVHRAKAYLDCNEEIHLVLRNAAKDYIAQNEMMDDEVSTYIDEAIRFSALRKFSPRNCEQQELYEWFTFDFVAAAQKNFQVTPREVRRPVPARIRFYFDEIAKNEIEYALKQWDTPGPYAANASRESRKTIAQANYNFGKLFHMSNLKVMSRSIAYAE